MGTMYEDFVTKFKKSKEYKTIAKNTVKEKEDYVVEEYLTTDEFKVGRARRDTTGTSDPGSC